MAQPLAPAGSDRSQPLERARRRLGSLFRDDQVLGRRSAIGCAALEISQPCNLDDTLCCLSIQTGGDARLAPPFREPAAGGLFVKKAMLLCQI
jgi:hypothetical protein